MSMHGRFWRSSEAAGGASEPAIAADALDRLRELAGDDSGEFLVELFEEFFVTSRELVDEIGVNQRSGDFDALRKSSHTLKGAALNLGANVLAAICKEGEVAAKESRDPGTDWFGRVEGEFARVREEFESGVRARLGA
jgi:HPt (histidine-containing phosphotransfer) domain-containing protein